MTRDDVMKSLEKAGTAQNRKVYAKHGIANRMFGVSVANLKALAKKLGVQHELANQLWKTGNHDAMILATMVADPKLATRAELAAWLRDLGNYVIAETFAGFAARTPYARMLAKQWGATRGEWAASAGWTVLAHLANGDPSVTDEDLAPYLRTIERGMPRARNRARYAMNGALIAIGSRGGALRDAAIETAERIGPVIVDHGETGCKTPNAAAYIRKAAARKVAKA